MMQTKQQSKIKENKNIYACIEIPVLKKFGA
jgi:hypothetical protein